MLEDFRLRVFTELADNGSFTLTSRNLGISQPAVSQNIAFLEQAVGGALFIRSKGQVSLTEKGASLLKYAKKIQYWYGRIDSELVNGLKPDEEPICIKISEECQAVITVEDSAINIRMK